VPAYANGIGPSLKLVCRGRDAAGAMVVTNLVADAQALGLVVHPYTLRADDLPDGYDSLEALLDVLVGDLGVDGLFTDFTDRVGAYLAPR
jgi:glycerophosphoryl diester phosphodiesterase